MMDVKFLSDIIGVTSQICCDDIKQIERQGFKTIICNRPDAESSDQTAADDIAGIAKKSSIKFIHIPITPGIFNEQDISDFSAVLYSAEHPILAYCRTGTRSATLWALSQAGVRSTEEIIIRAANAGYDLSPLSPRLEQIASDKNSIIDTDRPKGKN